MKASIYCRVLFVAVIVITIFSITFWKNYQYRKTQEFIDTEPNSVKIKGLINFSEVLPDFYHGFYCQGRYIMDRGCGFLCMVEPEIDKDGLVIPPDQKICPKCGKLLSLHIISKSCSKEEAFEYFRNIEKNLEKQRNE